MWKELITQILAEGWTQTQIAEEIGVTQPTIFDLHKGNTNDPKWTSGNKLIRLHRRVVKRKAA